jgi:hypothetical protein
MRKLTLKVETLRVESFDASPVAEFFDDIVGATRPQVCDPLTFVGPRCL